MIGHILTLPPADDSFSLSSFGGPGRGGRHAGKAEEVLPARAAWERFLEIIGEPTRPSPERQMKSLPPQLCHPPPAPERVGHPELCQDGTLRAAAAPPSPHRPPTIPPRFLARGGGGVWRGKGGVTNRWTVPTGVPTGVSQCAKVCQPGAPLLLSRSNGCPEIHSRGAPGERMNGEGFITDFRLSAGGQGDRQRRSLIQPSAVPCCSAERRREAHATLGVPKGEPPTLLKGLFQA